MRTFHNQITQKQIFRVSNSDKSWLIILAFVLINFITVLNMNAQAPEWQVDENKFEFTMTFQAFVTIEGRTLASEEDQLAAFVGDECRGVVNLSYVESEDRYLAYLVVFSNAQGEEVTFKVYDSENESIIEPAMTTNFEINAHFGNAFQAFSVAKPALNDEAELVDINLLGISTIRKEITETGINLIVGKGANLKEINSTFEVSPGAHLYMQSTLLAGENILDYSEPLRLQVLSEDQSVLQSWTINVSPSDGELIFYKKDAVCYAGGAIKIIYPENGEQLVLTQAGTLIATETVNNGEVLITDLPAGNYEVSVGAVSKEITIEFKEI